MVGNTVPGEAEEPALAGDDRDDTESIFYILFNDIRATADTVF